LRIEEITLPCKNCKYSVKLEEVSAHNDKDCEYFYCLDKMNAYPGTYLCRHHRKRKGCGIVPGSKEYWFCPDCDWSEDI